ncbi:tRNA lysidine(34) synthetase TilS [Chloroflexia bacterium SDU3-3]|nr:tRNA lysidine(34) synthetase TilS [Chloroflexia bacterium SDU3-3]
MRDAIARLFAAHAMAPRGALLVAAVSGGPDSLAMLHALHALREQLGIRIHVGHVDHMLRGAASAADAAFVAETARAWGLPCTVQAVDVAAYAQAQRLNLHDAARRARYELLAQLGGQLGAHAVATAHTASDQAETVLMHLLRGAGPDGLGGIRPVGTMAGARLVRPLLGVARAQVEQYCAAHQLRPRADATNADTAYTRNRLRHELLPHLASYNPQIESLLGRTAAICADESDFIQQALDAQWGALARQSPLGTTLDGPRWAALHPALQRAALRRAYAALATGEALPWEQVEQARALAAGPVGRRMPLAGGVWLQIGYGGEISIGAAQHSGPQLGHAPIELGAIGDYPLANGWRIWLSAQPLPPGPWAVALRRADLQPPLLARPRQPGDRIRPAGGRGSRSLQDLFVDAKLPRALRDRWPIIADAQRVLWVPGLRAAEAASGQAADLWIQICPPAV